MAEATSTVLQDIGSGMPSRVLAAGISSAMLATLAARLQVFSRVSWHELPLANLHSPIADLLLGDDQLQDAVVVGRLDVAQVRLAGEPDAAGRVPADTQVTVAAGSS